MMVQLRFRKATKEDLPAILALYAQPDLDNGKVLNLADAEMIFGKMAAYPNYHLHLALEGDKAIGTFAILIMDNLGHLGAPSAIIEHVAVVPTMQSKGVGKAMMQYAITLARQHQCYKITLSSNMKRERAHAFYESIGFLRHGYSFRIDLD